MSFNGQLLATGGVAQCLTDSVQVFGADGTYTTNTALYQFENNANDTTGNFNGTASNVTYGTGYIGQAAEFNGSSSYIDTAATLLPSNGSFSVSFWLKPNNQFGTILARGLVSTVGNCYGIRIAFDSTNDRIRFNRDTGVSCGSTPNANTGSSTITQGSWNHVVLVFDNAADTATFYINGAFTPTIYQNSSTGAVVAGPMASGAVSFLSTYDGGVYRIGNRNNNLSTAYYDGDLDEMRIYNRPITASEVATLYAETSATASNTNLLGDGAGISLYTLDYDGSDAGDIYNGTPTDVDFGVGGQILYGANFNGSSSKILLPNLGANFTGSSARSISAWVKIDATPSGSLCIFNSGTAGTLLSFGFFIGTSREIIISYYNRNWVTSETVPLNTWTHVVFTYNGGAVETSSNSQIYINNSLATLGGTTGSATGVAATVDSNNGIGIYGATNSFYFDGKIDQVRLFTGVISSAQVGILYAETACVYTCTTDTTNYPTTNTAYYKFDNTTDDETGVYDGTPSNISYAFGRFGQCGVFNGLNSSSRTKITTTGLPTYNNYSISFWINSNDLSSSADIIMGTSDNYAGNVGFGIYTGSPNTGDLNWAVGNGSSRVDITATGLTEKTWHHVVVSQNISNNEKKIYIDNVLKITSTSSINNTNVTYSLIIGGYQTFNNSAYDGKLDQIRIFTSVLSSSQVTELYNEKPCTYTGNFMPVTYTGNGTAGRFINNVGMDLETNGGLVWIKSRNDTDNHIWQDSVRGITNFIMSSSQAAQASSDMVVSLEANGFIFGADTPTGVNTNNINFVAWVWKGGGDSVTNNVGSLSSTVSANDSAGFSIVQYTGTASYTDTVGHGLSQAPTLIIQKALSGITDWYVLYNLDGTGAWDWAKLNQTDAFAVDSPQRFATTSTTFINWGWAGYTMINYLFYPVTGYSSFGTYTGNGSTTGPTVTVGFRASFVMIKRTDSTGSWYLFDSARAESETFLPIMNYANLTNVEYNTTGTAYNGMGLTITDTTFEVDFSSAWTDLNASGGTYLYMAFK